MYVLTVSRRVFANPRYFLVTLFSGGGLLLLLSLIPHLALISSAIGAKASLGQVFSLVAQLVPLFGVNNSVLGKVTVIITCILFGIQAAFLLYYIRRRKQPGGGTFAQVIGLSGLVAALFGVGCAACGSVIVVAILSLFGGAGLLLFLPLHGQEFGILGIALLVFAVIYLTKKINDPAVCSI